MILHGIEYQRPTSLNMRILADHVTYSFLAFMKSIFHFCLGCYCGGYSQNGRSNLSSYISDGKSMNPTYCILIFEPCSLILVVKPLEYLVKVQYQRMTWGIPRRGFAAQETSIRSFVQYAISSHFMRAEIEDSYIKLSIQSCCILYCMIWRLASEWYTIKMTHTPLLQWRHRSAEASQFTSNVIVCSAACSGYRKRKCNSSALLALCRRNSGHKRIPLTNGQCCGKCSRHHKRYVRSLQ